MKRLDYISRILFAFAVALAVSSAPLASANDEGKKEESGERHEREEKREMGGRRIIAENPAYAEECASCHVMYPPGLLPERSWEEIMKKAGDHFGENLGMEDKTRDEIVSFLKANSAEKSPTEWSGKILRSVGSTTPQRITEVPYIVREHRKIDQSVFKRPSIKSFSNCGACHKSAAAGDFEERNISIPK